MNTWQRSTRTAREPSRWPDPWSGGAWGYEEVGIQSPAWCGINAIFSDQGPRRKSPDQVSSILKRKILPEEHERCPGALDSSLLLEQSVGDPGSGLLPHPLVRY